MRPPKTPITQGKLWAEHALAIKARSLLVLHFKLFYSIYVVTTVSL